MEALASNPAQPLVPKRGGAFREALLAWYGEHRRDLPWRRTRDPYLIWISEIMLQQTRVAAVLEHYARFTARFPRVENLAAATEAEVLALWSGLGYYRRARMMHWAAQAIAGEHGGTMPRTAAGLLLLPGIGGYTSAAIASIAFGESVAVVDGNVERVLARVMGWSAAQPKFASDVRVLAKTLVPAEQAGDYNQAMMELGATVCLPKAPLCLHCPVQPFCRTRGEHIAAPRKKMMAREIGFALCTRGEGDRTEVLLEQRPTEASLMAGMWQLPEVEVIAGEAPAITVRHAITVTNYTVHVYHRKQRRGIEELSLRTPGLERVWYSARDLDAVAMTGLARKVLRRTELYHSPSINSAGSAGLGLPKAIRDQ